MKLKDIGKIVTGKTPSTKQLENFSELDDKYLFVTPRDMKDNCKYIESTERYLTSFVEDKFKSQIIKKDSVCISCIGSDMGKVYMINRPGITNQQINSITDIKDICNPHYLYYYFSDKKEYLKGIAGGSTMPILNKSTFENIEIDLPARNIQDKIVKILNNIDNKIELNNKTNDNLYELGDALYKEHYSKYENELPNGYKYLNLNEVSVNFDSKRKPMSSREREQHKGTYTYYGATSIIDYVDDYIFDDTYLLMGEDGTVKTSEGYPVLQYIWGKNWINNHAHVLQGTIISTEHLMFALRKKNIEALITGAVQPKINQVNMNKIKIIIGTDKVNKKFEEKIKIIVAKIKANTIENETLIQLRDTLLPKLMNGEIDLDKIEI